MATLNSWQRIDRVITGLPWGDGSAGNATINTDINTRRSCSGSASASTLSIASGAFSNGDIIFIMQMRGTGVGQWEINKVASGGGTTTLTLSTPLQYTYTDSGASQAQVVNIPQYDTLTINTTSITNWAGDTGGLYVVAGKTSITVGGAITADYTGFVGGVGGAGSGNSASYGEGTSGASASAAGTGGAANGSGGGGFWWGGEGGGAGGGHASAGGNGINTTGGSTSGASDLTTMTFGGGGGGGFNGAGYVGGDGGGIVVLISKSITLSAAINNRGQAGTAADAQSAGGGAGGSILFTCETASLGSNQAVATGGAGGSHASRPGGAGGAGRIAVHHSGTVTGTTNPTFTDVTDSTLVEATAGVALNRFYFM